jgi:iron complex transport system permease protein
MNVLSLPEEEASSLGVDVAMTRNAVVLCSTLLTSASVAVGGMIGWVGLIVPHIARLTVGPDNRRLLPASLLMGATFLLVVDDLARILTDAELPLGVLTAAIGAPLFLVLLAHSQRARD